MNQAGYGARLEEEIGYDRQPPYGHGERHGRCGVRLEMMVTPRSGFSAAIAALFLLASPALAIDLDGVPTVVPSSPVMLLKRTVNVFNRI